MHVALAVSLLALACCVHGNVPAFTIVHQSIRRGPSAPARVKKSRIEATPSFRHLVTSHKVDEAQRLASLRTSLRSKSQPEQSERLGSMELSRQQGLRERVANVTGSGNGRSVLAERARAAILAGRRACIVPGRGHVLQDSGCTSTHSEHSDTRGARAQHMEGQQQQGREAQEKVPRHGQLQGKGSHAQLRATEPPTKEFVTMAAQLAARFTAVRIQELQKCLFEKSKTPGAGAQQEHAHAQSSLASIETALALEKTQHAGACERESLLQMTVEATAQEVRALQELSRAHASEHERLERKTQDLREALANSQVSLSLFRARAHTLSLSIYM
jgi:hypothetical protein